MTLKVPFNADAMQRGTGGTVELGLVVEPVELEPAGLVLEVVEAADVEAPGGAARCEPLLQPAPKSAAASATHTPTEVDTGALRFEKIIAKR